MIPGYDGWGHLGQAYRTDQARSRSMILLGGITCAFDYGATGHRQELREDCTTLHSIAHDWIP
jgi:hypothetical protein